MKYMFLIIAGLHVICNTINAQENTIKNIYTDITTQINSVLLTKQSSMEISGVMSSNYDKTNFNTDQTKNILMVQIEPIFSYFIVDNLALGLDLSYHYQKVEYGQLDNSESTEQIFIGPLCKYYFGKNEFRPFVQADYLFLMGDNYEGGELGIGAGVFYHISGNFGINLQFKYGYIWSDKSNIESQNRLLVGIGLSAFLF